MSCRTGPLRVARPLRGGCTGLAGMILGGPPVGRDYRMPFVSGVEGVNRPIILSSDCHPFVRFEDS
jgi:hypothetical protein